MAANIFSIIPETKIREILGSLSAFTNLPVQLIDSNGHILLAFGLPSECCNILKEQVIDRDICLRLHRDAGRQALNLGEAYIFTCHANLNHIAFPLVIEEELSCSVIIGPFLMDVPDSTLVRDLAEQKHLSPGLTLELFEKLADVTVLQPAKVNQLKNLADQLLSSLLPGERAFLLQNQQKMSQQARINESIQTYKGEKNVGTMTFYYEKEKELVRRLRTGDISEIHTLLNELLGYVLFLEGGQIDAVRIRAVELTTLLSREALDGGANPDSIYQLNSRFLHRLFQERQTEEICLLMQEILESYMSAMFYEKDKGNLYIRRALRYMADHYSEHLNLEQVAAYVGLSPSYFSSLFRKTAGVSFREHLNWIRIEESKHLLLMKQYTLSAIALAVGFPDQSYYCKVFRKITGVSPGKYRQ